MRGPRPAAAALLALAALAALAPAHAAPGGRQVVFVEETTVYEHHDLLLPGETRVLPFHVRESNVTRVQVHLRWTEDGGATVRLEVDDPQGRPAGPPAASARGALLVEALGLGEVPPPVTAPEEDVPAALAAAASRAGQGAWRASARLDEDAAEAREVLLVVVVSHYSAIPLRVVTLSEGRAGLAPPPVAWAVVLAALSAAACALGVRLATRPGPKKGRSVSPRGDNTTSSTPGQGGCAPEG